LIEKKIVKVPKDDCGFFEMKAFACVKRMMNRWLKKIGYRRGKRSDNIQLKEHIAIKREKSRTAISRGLLWMNPIATSITTTTTNVSTIRMTRLTFKRRGPRIGEHATASLPQSKAQILARRSVLIQQTKLGLFQTQSSCSSRQ
jgi:hypothetical protein